MNIDLQLEAELERAQHEQLPSIPLPTGAAKLERYYRARLAQFSAQFRSAIPRGTARAPRQHRRARATATRGSPDSSPSGSTWRRRGCWRGAW